MAKLLLVDDNAMLLELMETLLSIDGHNVRAVKSGEAALEAVKAEAPDLVICDSIMPEMSGLELIEAVRRQPDWEGIPFLFITGKDSWELDKKVTNGKHTSLLIKPFDPDDLYEAVADALADGGKG